jgi:hypothetical protein
MTSLNELKALLTDDQRAILNKIWRHFLDHNEGNPWIPSGILYHKLGKGANEQTVHAILQTLGGNVVNEQPDHNGGKHYILTPLGFLLTEAGAEIGYVLSKYLEYMKRRYIDTDGTVGTIPLQEVATHFGFTEEQSFLLRRSLAVFYDLCGGGSLDAPSLPGCKNELIGKEDLRAWLIEREFHKFNPKVPINRNPFLSYGTEETHKNRSLGLDHNAGLSAPIVPNMKERKISSVRNPWIAGSFYLFALVVAITLLAVISNAVTLWALPFVLIGGLLAVTIIGAFQLRADHVLDNKSFLALMGETLKRLPLLRKMADETESRTTMKR